jgi:hypothetical protein
MEELITSETWRLTSAEISDDHSVVDILTPPTLIASTNSSINSSSFPVASSNQRGSYTKYSWLFKRYCVETCLKLNTTIATAADLLCVPRKTLSNWMHFKGFNPDVEPPHVRYSGAGRKTKLSPSLEHRIGDVIRLIRSRTTKYGAPKLRFRFTVRMLRDLAIKLAEDEGIRDFKYVYVCMLVYKCVTRVIGELITLLMLVFPVIQMFTLSLSLCALYVVRK